MPLPKIRTKFPLVNEALRDGRKGIHKAAKDLAKSRAGKGLPQAVLWSIVAKATKLGEE